jgi:hypothetical protein
MSIRKVENLMQNIGARPASAAAKPRGTSGGRPQRPQTPRGRPKSQAQKEREVYQPVPYDPTYVGGVVH